MIIGVFPVYFGCLPPRRAILAPMRRGPLPSIRSPPNMNPSENIPSPELSSEQEDELKYPPEEQTVDDLDPETAQRGC